MESVLRSFFEPPLSIREKLIIPVAFTGLIMSIYLVLGDIKIRGYCSTLGITPTCYLIADSYLLILLSLFFVKKNLKDLFFFSGIVLGISVSAYFSASHLLYINHCAMIMRTPDCFINLFLFSIILILRTVKLSLYR